MQDNNQLNNNVQPNGINPNQQTVNNNSGVVNQTTAAPMGNSLPNVNQVPGNVSYNNDSQGYIEPPKKRNSFVTYLIIFLILAGAAVGGYYAGNYIYHATHPSSAESE